MKLFRFKKIIIAICLVLSATVVFQPKNSDALWGFDWLNAGIQVVGHAIQGALLGIDSAMNTVQASLQTVKQFVEGLPVQYGPVRRGLGIATSTCDVLGGDLSAISTLNDLTSNNGSDGVNIEELDDRLVIPDNYNVPDGYDNGSGNTGGGSGNSDVAGDSTTVASNQTIIHEAANQIPTKAPRATNNEKLSTSLLTLGDQTKANLTLYITKKLGILKYRQVCYKTVQQTLKQTLVIAAWNEQLKEAYVDTLAEIEPRMSAINGHVASLEQQLNKAKQDIFKAIAASVAVDVTEQKTTEAINEVKPKLTVQNYEKIVDALAKQVYAPAMIKKNYDGNKQKQLIMTSFLNAELATDETAKKQALDTAKALVETELYDKCYQMYELENWNDERVFRKISGVMSNECDSSIVFSQYQEEFGKLMAASRESAKLEVNNGAGFLSTRTCKPVEEADKQKITDAYEAAKKYLEASQTQKQYEAQHEMAHSEYIPAVNETKAAIDNMKDVVTKVDGGITEQCSSINDAGSLSKGVIEGITQEMVGEQIRYNQDNPQQASKNAENLMSKVLGGIILNPSKTPSVLTETGKSFLETIFSQALKTPPKKTNPTSGTIPITNSNITVNTAQHSAPSPSPAVNGATTTLRVIPYNSPRGYYGGGF